MMKQGTVFPFRLLTIPQNVRTDVAWLCSSSSSSSSWARLQQDDEHDSLNIGQRDARSLTELNAERHQETNCTSPPIHVLL